MTSYRFDSPRGTVVPRTATSASLANGASLTVTHRSCSPAARICKAYQSVATAGDVVLLLRCDGTDGSQVITDETGKTITVSGNAQIDTAQSQFGGASILFDGTGDYLSLNGETDFEFDGDCTVEFFFRTPSIATTQLIYDSRPASTQGSYIAMALVSSKLQLYSESAYRITSGTLTSNTWYHAALVRSSGVFSLYIDGVSQGTWSSASTMLNAASRPLIAGNGTNPASAAFNGWLDDIRVTKGTAQYTSNFTPPTAAHPDPGGDPRNKELPLSHFEIWHDDGAGANADTETTFVNQSGGTLTDVTVEVIAMPALGV